MILAIPYIMIKIQLRQGLSEVITQMLNFLLELLEECLQKIDLMLQLNHLERFMRI